MWEALCQFADFGERAGIRTLDLLIKSQLLYRLSYALSPLKPTGGNAAEHSCVACGGQQQNRQKNA